MAKTCTRCKEDRAEDQFYMVSGTSRRRTVCKFCHLAQMKVWFAANKDKMRTYSRNWVRRNYDKVRTKRRKKMFGITQEDYDRLLAYQKGLCLGCSKPPAERMTLCVDHSHRTGAIRGLLCTGCNVALGNVDDDPETLRRLAEYIERAGHL